MDSDTQLIIYCKDDGEYRLYCNICDELCIERYYKSDLNSQTHTNNVRKRDQLIKSFQIILLI